MCWGARTHAKELSLFIIDHGDNGLVTIRCRGTALDRRSSAPAAFQQGSTECQYMMHGTCPRICTTDGFRSCSGSCFFCQWLTRCQQIRFFLHCFAYYFLRVHLLKSSMRKVKNKSQIGINQGFSTLFCLLVEGSGSLQILTDTDPEAQKHTDTDPPHWLAVLILIILIH
jgi:hypothetical protein